MSGSQVPSGVADGGLTMIALDRRRPAIKGPHIDWAALSPIIAPAGGAAWCCC